MADQSAADSTFGDVDDVILEPAAVRPSGQVAAEHAEAVALSDGRRRRDRQVQPNLVCQGVPGEVEVRLLQTGQQHRDEVGAVVLLERAELRIQLVEQLGQDRARVVLLELLVFVRVGRVPLVLELRRDEQLVDQRIAEPRDLLPLGVLLQDLAAAPSRERDLDDGTFGRRPDADDVAGPVVQLRQRDL